jgi:hypothetical protein
MRALGKKAYGNLYNQSTRDSPQRYKKSLRNDSLVIQKVAVIYEYRRVLAMYIMSSVFSYVTEKHSNVELNVGGVHNKHAT